MPLGNVLVLLRLSRQLINGNDSNNYIKTYSNDDDELMMLWEV